MSVRIAGHVAAALFVFAAMTAAPAQDKTDNKVYENGKVANYSVAAYDYSSPNYESFSFWSSPKDGNAVDYAYGKNGTRVRLRVLGPNSDGRSFAVQFPNGLMLDLVPQGDVLLVADRAGKYHKTFEWQYEGPVDGRGTFCQPCVEDTEAMPFVREHFLEK